MDSVFASFVAAAPLYLPGSDPAPLSGDPSYPCPWVFQRQVKVSRQGLTLVLDHWRRDPSYRRCFELSVSVAGFLPCYSSFRHSRRPVMIARSSCRPPLRWSTPKVFSSFNPVPRWTLA